MNPDPVLSTNMFDESQCAGAAGKHEAAENTASSDPSWPLSTSNDETVEEPSSASPGHSKEGKHLGRDFTPGKWDVVSNTCSVLVNSCLQCLPRANST